MREVLIPQEEYDELVEARDTLRSLKTFKGVCTLLQSILDERYPPDTIVCSDKPHADIGAQLTAAARKVVEVSERLHDIETGFKRTINEKCDPEKDDRVHCACVYPLREEIKRLKGLIARMLDAPVDGVEQELVSGRPYVTLSSVRGELIKYHKDLAAEAEKEVPK